LYQRALPLVDLSASPTIFMASSDLGLNFRIDRVASTCVTITDVSDGLPIVDLSASPTIFMASSDLSLNFRIDRVPSTFFGRKLELSHTRNSEIPERYIFTDSLCTYTCT
jgi:hypothetical protein